MSTETRDALRPSRVYQCPGCWSYGPAPRGDIECDCGERMENIDLRDAALRATDVPVAEGLREAGSDSISYWQARALVAEEQVRIRDAALTASEPEP